MSWSSGESSRVSTPSLADQDTFDDCATGLEDHTSPSDAPIPPTPEVLTSADNSQQPALEESPTPLFRNGDKNIGKGDTKVDMVPKEKITKLLKGKEKEWTKVLEKKGPLRLLDLPVDILQEIITHLPNTNDLTSLALCHSALHGLTTPHIYARFDIVWPPNDDNDDRERTGVDALTYGLATLVMTEESFGEAPWQREQRMKFVQQRKVLPEGPYPLKQRRRGNNFAQYTKKFSLGNGPPHWVREYLITKECGKMLGTLVAIAVAKMRNLESFVWDMPTGVLREVWQALSSLAERDDGEECRLNKIWVRWHDNEQAALPSHLPPHVSAHQPPPPPPPITGMAPPPPPASGAISQTPLMASTSHITHTSSTTDRVEHPTFSILPAVKSLSVVDIDEQAYLDEMSILIARSQEKLRELRVGLARHVSNREWQRVWSGDVIQQVDYSTDWTKSSRIGDKRLGGVLGTLVGRVYNLNNNADTEKSASSSSLAQVQATGTSGNNSASSSSTSVADLGTALANTHIEAVTAAAPVSATAVASSSAVPITPLHASHGPSHPTLTKKRRTQLRQPAKGPYLSGQLKLETLELERVPLSVQVLQKAIDWTKLTTLTLLSCPHDDTLWKSLRQQFSPMDKTTSNPRSPKASRFSSATTPNYALPLKKIHVNQVSPSLVLFLKETLAPNSLEVLFLQEARGFPSSVTIEQIYRGAIRRHRESLKKLMIDSSDFLFDGSAAPSQRWKKWMMTREILDCVTGGKMGNLRELGVSIDYRDWHYFLQRLPQIPHIRSLYIPNIADHPHGSNISPRELAMQIVNIVVLRPDIELCYLGIAAKCFEILENKSSDPSSPSSITDMDGDGGPPAAPSGYGTNVGVGGIGNAGFDDEDEEEEDEVDDEDVDGVEDGDEVGALGGFGSDDEDDTESESDDGGEEGAKGRVPRLTLREILFYEDKVMVFRARHGRL